VITVDENSHVVTDYEGKIKTPFRSFRWRPDLKWGFYCHCGNDNRLAPQEASDIDKLVDGDEASIQKIAASLLIPDSKQFEMRAV
jgi:hypothetical protein